MLSLGFSLTAFGIALDSIWIQNLGWALAIFGIFALAFVIFRFIKWRKEWQAKDKKLDEVRKLNERLFKMNESP